MSRLAYRFGEFTVSPARRIVLRGGCELPLIPRYFDLLVLLIERRSEAVHRREIMEVVWSDVVVSDGALSQAVRILRRTLGDDPREPAFIRTVQRHGYRFVFPGVVEEQDQDPDTPAEKTPVAAPEATRPGDPIEEALSVLLRPQARDGTERREAAERLHALGTSEALRRLGRRDGHADARALLRDTRWDVAAAGPVPILGEPGALRALCVLFALRLSRVVRLVGRRWSAATAGGALAGTLGGLAGALVLRLGPGSNATDVVLVALPVFGAGVGAVGAAGVGAGLAAAEALVRSRRGVALLLGGAVGGGAVGAAAHLLGAWTIEGLFGRSLAPVAGGFEGAVLGAAVGLGYALATPTKEGGMATPRGPARLRVAWVAGANCAAAAALLGWSGSYLGAMSLNFMAHSFPDSQVGLAPLARLLGEVEPGAVTRVAISAFEGLLFGAGTVLGLTHRPR